MFEKKDEASQTTQNRRYALDQAVKLHLASPVRAVTTSGASVVPGQTAHLVPVNAREVAQTARVFEQFLNNGDAVRDELVEVLNALVGRLNELHGVGPDDGAEHDAPEHDAPPQAH